MTLSEVVDTIKAYSENKLEQMKFNALLSYNNAYLASVGVSNAISGGDFPKIHTVYPGLFEEPKLIQQDSEIMKARITAYAEAWKAKNK